VTCQLPRIFPCHVAVCVLFCSAEIPREHFLVTCSRGCRYHVTRKSGVSHEDATTTGILVRKLFSWNLSFLQPSSIQGLATSRTYILSPFISVLCHSNCLFHGGSCPCLDVVHPGCVWSSSPVCTWHCSLHYLFLQATPLFLHGVTIVC